MLHDKLDIAGVADIVFEELEEILTDNYVIAE